MNAKNFGLMTVVFIFLSSVAFGIYTQSISFGIGVFFAILVMYPYHPKA